LRRAPVEGLAPVGRRLSAHEGAKSDTDPKATFSRPAGQSPGGAKQGPLRQTAGVRCRRHDAVPRAAAA
jgi:hypothetical protein